MQFKPQNPKEKNNKYSGKKHKKVWKKYLFALTFISNNGNSKDHRKIRKKEKVH